MLPVQNMRQLLDNAYHFTDAVHDQMIDREYARRLVRLGRVYLPVRYGNRMAFVPAKFLGYQENNLKDYKNNVYERNGGEARKFISRIIGEDAKFDKDYEDLLKQYCEYLGIKLANHRHSFWFHGSQIRNGLLNRDGIHDLDDQGGNQDPEYIRRMAGYYVRSEAVRKAVVARAKGACEYCGMIGFKSKSGLNFLESHHVIKLSEKGIDKLSNVIALCPNHHREAHFGERWKEMQDEFLKILKKI